MFNPLKDSIKKATELPEITLPTKSFGKSSALMGQSQDNKHIKNYWGWSILLFLLMISLLRVPFSGCYIDAFVFEFIYGYTKYIIYLWLIIKVIYSIASKTKFRVLWSFKFIYGELYLFTALSVLITGISHANLGNWPYEYSNDTSNKYWVNAVDNYIYGHFLPYALNPGLNYQHIDNEHTWFINSYFRTYNEETKVAIYHFVVSGGFISEIILISRASVLSIIAFIWTIIAVAYLMSYKSKRWSLFLSKIFNKLVGLDNKDPLSKNSDDVKVRKTSILAIKRSQIKNQTPPISFLTDTSVDNYQKNKLFADQVASGINRFKEYYQLPVTYQKTVIMPLFSEIFFTANSDKTIEEFIRHEMELAHFTKLNQFNISFKGSELRVEFPNQKPSKVSMKSILSNNKIETNKENALIGYGYGNNPLFINLHDQPNNLIIGSKGSGRTILISLILLTYCYLNSPENNEVIVINNKTTTFTTSIDKLVHVKKVIYQDDLNEEVIKTLDEILKEIKYRNTLFTNHKVNNIDEYNDLALHSDLPILKNKIIVFNDFTSIVKQNNYHLKLIRDLMSQGRNLGFRTIINADTIDQYTFDSGLLENIDNRFIMKLSTESESLQVFDNYRGFQLYKNGDGYYLHNNEKLRFQSCYLNIQEMNAVIYIINNFYKEKK